MDDPRIDGPMLDQALAELRTINHWLSGAKPTIDGIADLWRGAGSPTRLDVVDVGAGSGEMGHRLIRWAEKRGVSLRLTLVDLVAKTCQVARAEFAGDSRAAVVQADAFALPFQSVDIVTASLFTHHIPEELLPALYASFRQAARLGVVVNDLHRHTVAYVAIAGLTRLFSGNRMIRHDAPLSVARGFVPADFEAIRATEPTLRYQWRPWFRYQVTVPAA